MDSLRIDLGGFAFSLPIDRQYSLSHLWLEPKSDDGGPAGRFRVGITPYLTLALGEALLIDWYWEAGNKVEADALLAEIEGSLGRIEVRAPAEGTLLRLNEHLLGDPSTIHSAPYDLGWLCEFRTFGNLLPAEEYRKQLASVWTESNTPRAAG